MPCKTINMHGKLYSLFDEVPRTKKQAQDKAADIREKGQVAFLNPSIKKEKETKYFIYVAEKAVRIKIQRNISIKILLEKWKEGINSFSLFMLELEKGQIPPEIDVPEKETSKKTIPKKSSKKPPKKTVPKKQIPKENYFERKNK